MGNYRGYGDTKFVPNITFDRFETIVRVSAAFNQDPVAVEQIWDTVKVPMYSITERQKQLGLGEKGVTTYVSDNCDREDSDKINR